MKLSETGRGSKWLQNFSVDDRPTANRLIDSLVLVGWDQARLELLQLASEVIAESRQEGPIWVLSVLDGDDIRKRRNLGPDDALIAFENYSPGEDIGPLPGSEARIGHLIRDLRGKNIHTPNATLDELRLAQIRTVLILTDDIESGSQAVGFLDSLYRNKTIKSWRSFGWISVVIAAYAVSPVAEKRLLDHPLVDQVRFHTTAPAIGSLPWSQRDIEEALRICKAYGRGKRPLGYGKHAGLFGFWDRVPNTVPSVFTRTGSNWHSLFDHRKVPVDLQDDLLGVPPPEVIHQDLLEAVRQARLSTSITKQLRQSNKNVLTALALATRTTLGSTVLSSSLGKPQEETQALLHYLKSQGWIDNQGELTSDGHLELEASKRHPRAVNTVSPKSDPNPYYPGSLR